MPELHDEQESMFWPWVLGILVLALVVWVAAQLSGETEDEPQAQPVARTAPALAPAAAAEPVTPEAFLVWVRDSAAILEREGSDQYARTGLARLSSAVAGIARASGDRAAVARAEEIATAAGAAQPDSAGHTDTLAGLFIGAAALVEELNTGGRESVARNLEQARNAAAELDATAPLDQQRHRVYRYFDFIGEAVAGLAVADSARS